jgi:hypothetical protein
MNQQCISQDDLAKIILDKLNEIRLSNQEERIDDGFKASVYHLSEPDPDGCNWSLPYVDARCGGDPIDVVDTLKRIIPGLRKKYNLFD